MDRRHSLGCGEGPRHVKTAVLIINYNTREDLRACLQRLLSSGASPESVFVADNASTDGSWEMIEEDFPQVRRFRNTSNLLYAEATNQLWALSDSDWTLLLNPDVLCRFNELKALPEKWHTNVHCAAVAPQLRHADGRIQPSCRRFPDALTVWREAFGKLLAKPSHWKMGDFDHRVARAVPQPMFSCLWIRRSAWQVVGGLDTRYPLFFNDVDWCQRALKAGYEIQFDPSVAVLHRHGGTTSRHPVRKLCHSSSSFARYLLGASQPRWLQFIGLLGLAIWLSARLPLALVQSVRD